MSKDVESQLPESTPGTVDKPADSPPAAEPIPVSVSDTLKSLSRDDYKKWEAGDDSVLLPKDKPAEPAGKSEPEPAPGKEEPSKQLTPEERSRRDKERGDKRQHEYWRDRAVEEKTRRETLERELAEFKKKLEAAPGSAPKAETAPDGQPVPPKKPRLGQFQSIEEFDAADEKYETDNRAYLRELAKWEIDQRDKAWQSREAEVRRIQTVEENARQYHQLADDYEKDHPDYPKSFEMVAQILADASQGKGGYIDAFILRSKLAPQIVDYLATHPQELTELVRTPPEDGLVALGEIQAGLKTVQSKAPRPKEHTSAPPPVIPADGRSQTPEDPAEAAFKRGDMKTWERLQNEKELRRDGLIP